MPSWSFPSQQSIKAAFASMTNMASNRALGLMQGTELKQLKDTTNLLDNKANLLSNTSQSTAVLPHLPNAAQLNIQTALNQNNTLSLQANQQTQETIQQQLQQQQQQTTNNAQQLTISKDATSNQQSKTIKLEPPVNLLNNVNLANLANLTNNKNSSLSTNNLINNTINNNKKEINVVEDINIEDDEPIIEDEEIDAVDDLGNSEEDDSTSLKQRLKQQQQRNNLLRRSAFSDPKVITSHLAKFNSHLNSTNMISALNQIVNTKHAMAAAVASLTNGSHSPNGDGSIKSPNSTASATTLPTSGDDSPNSSFNSISIAGSLKKRRKYSTILSIDDILQNKPNDI